MSFASNGNLGDGKVLSAIGNDIDIEAEMRRFEVQERERLGLPGEKAEQWRDPLNQTFTAAQRSKTTILACGLTMAQDLFIQSALRGLGYNIVALEVPDNQALQYGREFGNRGQCNPTYFTVGNLVKYLDGLRQNGMTAEDIVERYVFLTAGACGPCRFGTYVTEYRKALRDAGFDGFRVLLFQQTGGLKQATGEEMGLQLNPPFFLSLLQGIVVGDVLNALVYRIRPYETESGAADKALARCKEIIARALERRTSIMRALVKCRRILGAVEVDRTVAKPRVAIIGEFWAMTTEGDGNYNLQRFLESEGAEVEIQLVTAWILFMIWEARYDTQNRAELRGTDEGSPSALADVDVRTRLLSLAVAERALRIFFQTMAKLMGLTDYHLPDMDEIAEISHAFYDNNLRGGEGHMEVGKLIQNVVKNKVNMTLSVKPFGCMPSSSVSDGVQSLITELHPEAIFLPIETSGDGAVNVYSRIQMQLFKAKQVAEKECQRKLDEHGLTPEGVRALVAGHRRLGRSLHKSPHAAGCTAADLIDEVGKLQVGPAKRAVQVARATVQRRRSAATADRSPLATIARRAAARAVARTAEANPAAPRPSAAAPPRPAAAPPIPAGRIALPVV